MTRKVTFNWSNVNWEEQDITISRQLGCSRERVRQRRIEFAKPRPKNYHKHQNSMRDELLACDTSKMTIEDIISKFKCSKPYVLSIFRANKKAYIKGVDKRKGGKYDWSSITSWLETDRQIAEKLGVSNVGVVTGHRRRLGIIKRQRYSSAHKENVHKNNGVKIKV